MGERGSDLSWRRGVESPSGAGLRKDRLDDIAVHIRQTVVAASMAEGQAFVIQAQQMQDGRVEIVHMNPVFSNGRPQIVGRSIGESPLDARARHPRGEAGTVVTATLLAIDARGSAEH